MHTCTKDTTEWLLDEAKKVGADHADILVIDAQNVSVSCRKGEQDNLERSESAGVSLRVWVGQSTATVSSSDLTNATLKTLVQQAYDMAKASTPNPHERLADAALLAHHFNDVDLYDAHETSIDNMFADALEAEAIALSTQGITNSEGADASSSSYALSLATSAGFFGSYQSSMHALSVCVIAGEGSSMERDYDYTSARHISDLLSPAVIDRKSVV